MECKPSSDKSKASRKKKWNKSFTEAVKEKYSCDDDEPTFGFILVGSRSPKRKNTAGKEAELAHLRTVVLNNMSLTSAGIPAQGLADLCPNVVDLDLADNSFSHWSELLDILTHLPHVKFVNFSRNSLAMEPDFQLPDTQLLIENLALNDTGVTLEETLRLSKIMPHLKEIHLCGNKYDRLPDIKTSIDDGHFGALECLRLNNNGIDSWSEVWKLRHLPQLKNLILSGNPIKDIFYVEEEVSQMNVDEEQQSDGSIISGHNTNSGKNNYILSEDGVFLRLSPDNESDNTNVMLDMDTDRELQFCDFSSSPGAHDTSVDNFDDFCDDSDRPHSRFQRHEDSDSSDKASSDKAAESPAADISMTGDEVDGEVSNSCFNENVNFNNSGHLRDHKIVTEPVEENTDILDFTETYTVMEEFDLAILESLIEEEEALLQEAEALEDEFHKSVAEAFLMDIIDSLSVETPCEHTTLVETPGEHSTPVETPCEHSTPSDRHSSELTSPGAMTSQEELTDGRMMTQSDEDVPPVVLHHGHSDNPVDDDDRCVSAHRYSPCSIVASSDSLTEQKDDAGDRSSNVEKSDNIGESSNNVKNTESVDNCGDCDNSFKTDGGNDSTGTDNNSDGPQKATCDYVIDNFASDSLQSQDPNSSSAMCGPYATATNIESNSDALAHHCLSNGNSASDNSNSNNSNVEMSDYFYVDISGPKILPTNICSPRDTCLESAKHDTASEIFSTTDTTDSLTNNKTPKCESNTALQQQQQQQQQQQPQQQSSSSSATCCEVNQASTRSNINPELGKLESDGSEVRPDPNPAPKPFSRLESLCLSEAEVSHWRSLHALAAYPCLKHVRMLANPLYSSVHPDDRRKLYISSLPNVTHLNGSEVTVSEREKAERHYLRHFMDDEEKPDVFHDLVEKHGPPVKLVDINLGAGYKKWVSLTFILKFTPDPDLGVTVTRFTKKVGMAGQMKKLNEIVCKEMGLPRRPYILYHVYCGPSHAQHDRGTEQIHQYESLPMSRFDFADGDEVHVYNKFLEE